MSYEHTYNGGQNQHANSSGSQSVTFAFHHIYMPRVWRGINEKEREINPH